MWRHVQCVTAQQLTNMAGTYGSDEYAVIPGWAALSEDDKSKVAGVFDGLKSGAAVGKVEKEKSAKAKAAKQAATDEKKMRREKFLAEPGDWFDWKGLLQNGELAEETGPFLKTVCDFLGLAKSGGKAVLLQRLTKLKDGGGPKKRGAGKEGAKADVADRSTGIVKDGEATDAKGGAKAGDEEKGTEGNEKEKGIKGKEKGIKGKEKGIKGKEKGIKGKEEEKGIKGKEEEKGIKGKEEEKDATGTEEAGAEDDSDRVAEDDAGGGGGDGREEGDGEDSVVAAPKKGMKRAATSPNVRPPAEPKRAKKGAKPPAAAPPPRPSRTERASRRG
jgi:hypothetical protein